MKPRNREINIFNMSLLDVLCGALGTFCFLMLVLFPYYSIGKNAKQAPDIPPGVDPKTLEEAKARIQQLEDTLKKFQDFVKDLQNQNTQLQEQAKQLQDQTKQLTKYATSLEMRNPFVAAASFALPDGDQAEVGIEDDRKTDDGKRQSPKLDPSKPQGVFWTGDLASFGPSNSYWMVRDGPPGTYRFFFKVIKHNTAAGPLAVQGSLQSNSNFEPIPRFWVAQAQAVVPLGIVTVSQDDKANYLAKVEINVPKELQQAPAQMQSGGVRK